MSEKKITLNNIDLVKFFGANNMKLDKIKSKHWDLMKETFGYAPTDEQIKRIGKQVFYHIQMECLSKFDRYPHRA